jgi:hypothetical protein
MICPSRPSPAAQRPNALPFASSSSQGAAVQQVVVRAGHCLLARVGHVQTPCTGAAGSSGHTSWKSATAASGAPAWPSLPSCRSKRRAASPATATRRKRAPEAVGRHQLLGHRERRHHSPVAGDAELAPEHASCRPRRRLNLVAVQNACGSKLIDRNTGWISPRSGRCNAGELYG